MLSKPLPHVSTNTSVRVGGNRFQCACLHVAITRGGSRISEKGAGGLLINIHEAGEGGGGGAPAANAFLVYHAHNTT